MRRMHTTASNSFAILCIGIFLALPLFAQDSPDEGGAIGQSELVQEREGGGAAPTEGTLTPRTKTKGSFVSLWTYFRAGGILMWPLLALAAFAIALAVDRFVYFRRVRYPSRAFIERLEKTVENGAVSEITTLCEENPNPLTKALRDGVLALSEGHEVVERTMEVSAGIETSAMERWLTALLAIGNVAPMMGFLGTVTGMVSAFDAIAAADQISAKIVASGIKEALITTVTGLIIAIPTLLIHNYFQSRIEGYTTAIERIGSVFVERTRSKGFRADAVKEPLKKRSAFPRAKKSSSK